MIDKSPPDPLLTPSRPPSDPQEAATANEALAEARAAAAAEAAEREEALAHRLGQLEASVESWPAHIR